MLNLLCAVLLLLLLNNVACETISCVCYCGDNRTETTVNSCTGCTRTYCNQQLVAAGMCLNGPINSDPNALCASTSTNCPPLTFIPRSDCEKIMLQNCSTILWPVPRPPFDTGANPVPYSSEQCSCAERLAQCALNAGCSYDQLTGSDLSVCNTRCPGSFICQGATGVPASTTTALVMTASTIETATTEATSPSTSMVSSSTLVSTTTSCASTSGVGVVVGVFLASMLTHQ